MVGSMKKPIDKAGLIFVALLCVLIGLVLSIALFRGNVHIAPQGIAPQGQDGSLIPRTAPHQQTN